MSEQVVIDWCHVHGYADGGSPEEYEHHPLWETPCRLEEWTVMLTDSGDFSTNEEVHIVNEDDGFFTLKAGDLSFVYTVQGGLVPSKVLVVREDGETEVLITADRNGWHRGEKVKFASPNVSLVARPQVSRRSGRHRINGRLRMVTDSGRLLP